MISQKFTLTSSDVSKWLDNQLTFLIPLAAFIVITYLTPIQQLLMTEGYVLDPSDLVPSAATINAILLYITNALFDILRKYLGEKHYE